MKPHELGASELARRLAQRELSALEVVEDCLAEIAARDAELRAWAAVDPEFARRQARALDAGAVRGMLHGVPVGVKDIFDTADLPTEYGSPIYAGHRPAWDAACVAAARAAGAVVLGKTVTTEFATMVPARTMHPRNPRHTPGGSSSGSAAAVAARMVPLAYGTQTVGSIIRPAAYCGIVGYKPSYGMLSRSGMKMGAESLDTPGAIARSVEDVALLVAASAMRPELAYVTVLEKQRLGVCCSPNWPQMTREGAQAFERVVQTLDDLGATMVDAELPDSFGKLDGAAQTILNYEMARGLAHEAAHHRSRVSPILVERIDIGTRTAYREYALAIQYASDCRKRLAEHARGIDAILTPSATGEAPLGLASTGNTAMNRLWTLLHGPCITVPAGDGPAGMPLGVQLVGIRGGKHADRADAHLLAVARWVESVL
jgi:Asp-tRNA(Asn)/Glu-tRNA(Gln) amidotransferase A subunit family amidase